MHSRFGLKYIAADALADKCGATRQGGKSGLAAIQPRHVDELQQTLALLGSQRTWAPSRNASTSYIAWARRAAAQDRGGKRRRGRLR